MDNEYTAMVVDDDYDIQLLIVSLLRELGFRKIIRAWNGMEALREIKQHEPDILILDWYMPRMDGLALLEHLRQNNIAHNMAILMLTVNNSKEDVQAIIAQGVDDYLVKPLRKVPFKNRVQDIMDKYSQALLDRLSKEFHAMDWRPIS